MSEFVDLYDRNRKFLNRVVDRNTYLFQPGEFMMYVLAILENEEGKFLVTQRALDKKWAAGGWEMPGGGAKSKESSLDAIKREVKEETGANATIIQYVGKSHYSFTVPEDNVEKDVHWYLMMGESYYSKPQREEYFMDSGYYKFHEAYHLLKFSNEKQILEKAYNEYIDLKKSNLWGTHMYY